MKAITLRQPHASLVAAGVKTIETRPRPTSYRGRIAIHAAAASPKLGSTIGDWQVDETIIRTYPTLALVHYADGVIGGPDRIPLPLGAVVASAVLTDCLPILGPYEGHEPPYLRHDPDAREPRLTACAVPISVGSDQLPFGDFSPGRWALLLDDIAPTTQRCPWCWGGAVDTDGYCHVCDDDLRCDPVPARGQQAVPWTWEP